MKDKKCEFHVPIIVWCSFGQVVIQECIAAARTVHMIYIWPCSYPLAFLVGARISWEFTWAESVLYLV